MTLHTITHTIVDLLQVIGTDLNMPSFGVCYIKDMLIEVSDSQVIVSGSGDHAVMSIPRKGNRRAVESQTGSVKLIWPQVV